MTPPDPDPAATRSDNACYRHPDRRSFVLCQRCARTVCGECQTPAPVGVICPECMKADRAADRAAARARPRRAGQRFRTPGGLPPVTFAIMVVCVVVYLGQVVTGWLGFRVIDAYGAYSPAFTDLQHGVFEPWRMLTAAFLHASPLHILFNLLTLWIFGRELEPLLGSLRFATLYLVSALGGSLAVAILDPTAWVVGASGAVFGLFGVWLVMLRRMRADMTPMLVLLGINVVMAFLNPGISWQAHLGGAITGAICGWFALRDLDHADRAPRAGLWAMIAIGIVCLALPPIIGLVR